MSTTLSTGYQIYRSFPLPVSNKGMPAILTFVEVKELIYTAGEPGFGLAFSAGHSKLPGLLTVIFVSILSRA